MTIRQHMYLHAWRTLDRIVRRAAFHPALNGHPLMVRLNRFKHDLWRRMLVAD